MNNKSLFFVIAGLLFLLAALLIIPATNQMLFSLFEGNTQGSSTVSGDFDAFIPFIPGYFPEDFMITAVGTAVDETPGMVTYSEFYASDEHFFKIIQSQGKDVPLVISDGNLTIQDNAASLSGQVDVDGLVGDDLDLSQYDTSESWLLTVVMKEIHVQVISNQPREEVIRFAMEMIPKYCINTPTPKP